MLGTAKRLAAQKKESSSQVKTQAEIICIKATVNSHE